MTSMKTKQTFELSESDVKTAISEFIESKFGPGGPIAVSMGTRTVTTGYGMSESDMQVVSVSVSREPSTVQRRAPLSADEAREDELRLVTNHLHASGIFAWREAARELTALKHRVESDPH